MSATPLRVPSVEPTGAQTTFPQETNRVVRVHAVRAAAVRNDLTTARKGTGEIGELVERDRTGARDMAGGVLVDRTNVEDHDAPLLEPRGQLGGGDRLNPVAVAEVVRREHLDLGYVFDRDVA